MKYQNLNLLTFSDLHTRNETKNTSITDVLCPNKPNHNHPGVQDSYFENLEFFNPETNDNKNDEDDWGIFTPKTAPLYLLILLPGKIIYLQISRKKKIREMFLKNYYLLFFS